MNIYKKITLLLIGIICTVCSCGRKGEMKEYNIIPEPTYLNVQRGIFSLTKGTKVCFENQGQNEELVKYVSATFRQVHFHPSVVGEVVDNSIVFRINEQMNPELGTEGYLLEVKEKGITISANTEAGLFYGFQTLLQMLPADIHTTRYSKVDLAQCTILDAPRFGWRGSHLDVSRHFFTVSEVKAHLDLMAQYKLNKFHWHLTDDHGWRIEIEKYPKLNDIASFRVDRNDVPWGEAEPAAEGESATYGGFYTKDEIAEVVAYAAQRHIDVIPEIEIPGHCAEILAAYPEFACAEDDTTYQVQLGPYWPPRAILCAGNDSVVQFLFDIMDEVVPLFPYEYVHIGGDEALKDNWTHCPLCQHRIAALGLQNENQLQNWLIMQVEGYLKGKGRRIIGWDEILDGPISSEATVMSWRGWQGGIEAARRGNHVIMTPTQYCYLDYVQGNPTYQPPAMPHPLPLHTVYQFDPAPPQLAGKTATYVLGGQANLWTEYINTYSHAQYMLLPRLCAISECVWSAPNRKNWEHFRHKVAWHKQRLSALGLQYCEGSFKPIFAATSNADGSRTITLDSEVEGTQLFYAIDANPTEPNTGSLYMGPFTAQPGQIVHVASFYRDTLREEVYHFEIK